MARPTAPLSQRTIQARAEDLKRGPWTHQTLKLVAYAMLLALEEGLEPGEAWDLSTAGGQEGLQKHLLSSDYWAQMQAERAELLEKVARDLESALLGTKYLESGFYLKAAKRVAELLEGARELPVALALGITDVRKEKALGLPPKGHPLAAQEEELALAQVSWLAARGLWRTIGNREEDAEGRCGLSRPEVLKLWAEKLGLIRPGGQLVEALQGAVERADTCLPLNRLRDSLLSPNMRDDHDGHDPGHLLRPRTGAAYEALVRVASQGSVESLKATSFEHVVRANEMLKACGPQMAMLSLYLSMHVCRLAGPSDPFVLTSEALLADFGQTAENFRSKGESREEAHSALLEGWIEMAELLDRMVVRITDRTSPDGSVYRLNSRVWNISIMEKLMRPQQLSLTGDAGPEKLQNFRLMVRAGDWAPLYASLGRLWYTPVAVEVLKLSTHPNLLVGPLAVYLSTTLREQKANKNGGGADFFVRTLLDRVMVAEDLERALEDPAAGRNLRRTWRRALETLAERLNMRFSFDPATYPAEDIPEAMQPSVPVESPGNGSALERLLRGKITVGWPEEVLEQPQESLLSRQVNKPLPPATRLNTPMAARCELLRKARRELKLTLYEAARLLGTSAPTLSRTENAKRIPKAAEMRDFERAYERALKDR